MQTHFETRELLVVSYYTPGTIYEDHARALAHSLDRLSIDHRIEPRASRGSWVENCAQKARFVGEMRGLTARPLLWIDADAYLVRPLHELRGIDADFAVVKREGWSFYGGQIYFGTGAAPDRLLDRWIAYCERHPHVWDQVSLGYAWWDIALEGRLRSHWLPKSFSSKEKGNAAGRLFQRAVKRSAILHRQESRTSKDVQTARQGEFTTWDLPEWWRRAASLDKPFPLDAAHGAELGLG